MCDRRDGSKHSKRVGSARDRPSPTCVPRRFVATDDLRGALAPRAASGAVRVCAQYSAVLAGFLIFAFCSGIVVQALLWYVLAAMLNPSQSGSEKGDGFSPFSREAPVISRVYRCPTSETSHSYELLDRELISRLEFS